MVSIDNFKDIYYKYAHEDSPELVFFFGLVPVRWCLQGNIHYDIYTWYPRTLDNLICLYPEAYVYI